MSSSSVRLPVESSQWEREGADIDRHYWLKTALLAGCALLGLALCRRIMALHGGSLRIAESSPEGTTFELTFPETTP